MQVRFSIYKGIPVLDEHSSEVLGALDLPFIHPDTGKIEGFFIKTSGWFAPELFLPTDRIVRWGKYVWIRDGGGFGPLEDIIRLQILWDEGRHVLGQPMISESGKRFGICRDVQFHTQLFIVQWLFPRRFLWWGAPIPVHAVSEVTEKAIVIRDSEEKKEVTEEEEILRTTPTVEPALRQS
ncbi:hypothetical protein COU77_00800 [Candidatus Peregrinibacteria bacterium CG10_big_fil_rev_8_21_14_0_10_49_16]|nr:MAG: hypothetical protein COW95_03060 [Candidatus Peregrinibacteria bacterium CG22_combo_CG10-13_8_21_14_all_49_11]PIR52363.1 MAG: hypothetical protein COU77_00800 [Candidatus Peregrinibacteria bacterium CG10_big_fil_rev_8_21_14_0_10_49_16]